MISGHRRPGRPDHRLVDQAIRLELARHAPDVTSVSCLAEGAEQIFACAVTDLGGTHEAVIPVVDLFVEDLAS